MRRLKDSMSGILNEFGQKDGFDLVYECTGAEMAIQMSVFVSTFSSSVCMLRFLFVFTSFPYYLIIALAPTQLRKG